MSPSQSPAAPAQSSTSQPSIDIPIRSNTSSPAPNQPSDSIPTLRTARKPNFTLPSSGPSDLRSRLQAFLPQMAAANAELEKLKSEGGLEGKTLEDVGEGEDYVEMELGLGVLKEKKQGEESSSEESSEESSSSEEEDSSDDEDVDDEAQQKKAKQKEDKEKEKDVLGRLMGHKHGREKAASIQEVE